MTRFREPVTRRAFVRTLGLSGAAVPALVTARGREALGALWPGTAQGAARAQMSAPIISLESNENPNGPGLGTLNAIRDALSLSNRYPYDEADALTSAIAREHRVEASQVLLGCGSAEILRMAMQAFTSRSRHLVAGSPTFEAPGRYANAFGVLIRPVRVDAGLKLDLAAMETSAPRAGLVYLCNPNNPTATVLSARAITGFVDRLARVSPQTAVLVDEAYHEYVDDPSYGTSIPTAIARRNVVVCRTFSKVHGLAGLRCGYAIAQGETIAQLARFKLESSVNQLAIAAARAALGDRDRVERERTLNRTVRESTRQLFASLGLSVGPSETNFVLVDLGRDSRAFRDACRRAGVAVGRPFPPLDNYTRISIGTADEMQRAGAVFKRVLGRA
jgi:histidinol-phosphate aminotransferase